ncbi:hypothetical protein HYX17_01000 [Candidatus Woesearchaeota archaeon]|nr:hypothetical protein [Candidatus Woesearchaeota archaeon]
MALTEREQRCSNFINEKLEEPLEEGSLEFYTWKNMLGIRDPEKFHKIAQSLKIKGLKKLGGIHYYIGIPGDNGNYWEIMLVGSQSEEFLQKYGVQYKVE